jgi:hypothetical protein
VNARDEGFVECFDPVRGQEEDALEVFEEAEEDADESVAMDVVDRAFFEEDVGFVEQEERTPAVGDVWVWSARWNVKRLSTVSAYLEYFAAPSPGSSDPYRDRRH